MYFRLTAHGLNRHDARIANTNEAGENGGEAKPYEERTKEELYQQAIKAGIEGRSDMSKKELIEALRTH